MNLVDSKLAAGSTAIFSITTHVDFATTTYLPKSFIYKSKTSTTSLYETMQCNILINKLIVWVQSAFTHNPGTTISLLLLLEFRTFLKYASYPTSFCFIFVFFIQTLNQSYIKRSTIVNWDSRVVVTGKLTTLRLIEHLQNFPLDQVLVT